MATFRVNNLSGGKLAVPPPLDVILPAGGSADVEAASADTPAIALLQDRGLIKVTQLTSGAASDATEAASLGLSGTSSMTKIGTIDNPVVIGAGQTMTLTHNLGNKADTVDVYDSDGANFTADADITVAQADANTLAVTSAAGGSFVIVVSFKASVDNDMGANLDPADSRIAVA